MSHGYICCLLHRRHRNINQDNIGPVLGLNLETKRIHSIKDIFGKSHDVEDQGFLPQLVGHTLTRATVFAALLCKRLDSKGERAYSDVVDQQRNWIMVGSCDPACLGRAK